MESDAIVTVVVNVDEHRVSFTNPYLRPWEAAVHRQHALRHAQLRKILFLQLHRTPKSGYAQLQHRYEIEKGKRKKVQV